jgi:hypothetical protein
MDARRSFLRALTIRWWAPWYDAFGLERLAHLVQIFEGFWCSNTILFEQTLLVEDGHRPYPTGIP